MVSVYYVRLIRITKQIKKKEREREKKDEKGKKEFLTTRNDVADVKESAINAILLDGKIIFDTIIIRTRRWVRSEKSNRSGRDEPEPRSSSFRFVASRKSTFEFEHA